MKYKLICWIFFSLLAASAFAQQDKGIRIADTLTAQEKSNRSTVLLQSELDSLIRLYNANQPKTMAAGTCNQDREQRAGVFVMGGDCIVDRDRCFTFLVDPSSAKI